MGIFILDKSDNLQHFSKALIIFIMFHRHVVGKLRHRRTSCTLATVRRRAVTSPSVCLRPTPPSTRTRSFRLSRRPRKMAEVRVRAGRWRRRRQRHPRFRCCNRFVERRVIRSMSGTSPHVTLRLRTCKLGFFHLLRVLLITT